MTPIVEELLRFARDQLAVQPNWHGQHYVQRCLNLWAKEYGSGVAEQVRLALGDSLNPHGQP